MNTDSHPIPCSNRRQTHAQTSKRQPIGNQSLSQTLMANYWNLFNFLLYISDPRVDLPEPTAISTLCQRHKRISWARHLHIPAPTTLKLLSSLPNWWSSAAHKSHLRRGGRTMYPDCNWNCTGRDILWECNCTKCHITFLKVLQPSRPQQFLFHPVHPLIQLTLAIKLLSQTLMANYWNLFNFLLYTSDPRVDLPEPTAISKTQEELRSTAPPFRFADDPETSIFPPEFVKLCLT